MSKYELVFIVRPDVASNHAEQLAAKYNDIAKEAGAKIIKTENWGLRTLAYRINKHRKGYYVMLGLETDGKVIAELERQMRISDDIIRFLTIRDDELTAEPSIMMAPKKKPRAQTEKSAS
jgi:small subunit ribosomal protein S6